VVDKTKLKFLPPKKAGFFVGKNMGEKLRLPTGENLLNPNEIGNYFKVNNPDGLDVVFIDVGQPRISSTARALLLANAGGVDEVHFQPWKYIQRYSRRLARIGSDPKVMINKTGRSSIVVLKETPGGPNDPKENFDPIEIALQAGINREKLRVLLGIREPFAQFESWLKFDSSRRPKVFFAGLEFLLGLYSKYEQIGLRIEPFIFELQYYNPDYIEFIYNKLIPEVQLPENLKFGQGEKIAWHEANPALDRLNLGDNDVGSSYYQRVVVPVAQKGQYRVSKPDIINPERFENSFPCITRNCSPDGINILKEAAGIYLKKTREIYQQQITTGLSPNDQFEQFLTSYETNLQRI
jgi:hypothetical protein